MLNNHLGLAVALSTAIHALVLSPFQFITALNKPKLEKPIEIKYLKTTQPKENLSKNITRKEREPLLKQVPKVTLDKKLSLPVNQNQLNQEFRGLVPKLSETQKPHLAKQNAPAIKSKMIFTLSEKDKIKDPVFLSYSEVIRKKIERIAHDLYFPDQPGEVCLSFILTREGLIRFSKVLEDKTLANRYLKELALKSLQQAAPFPEFPQGMRGLQQTFTLSITFETE